MERLLLKNQKKYWVKKEGEKLMKKMMIKLKKLELIQRVTKRDKIQFMLLKSQVLHSNQIELEVIS